MTLQSRTPMKRTGFRVKPGKCCGKKAFATREAAEAAIWKISLVSSRKKIPRRAYECRNEWWHLTSQAKHTDPPQSADELVHEREQYRCAKCGVNIFSVPDRSVHHRRNRGSGGSSDPAINLPSNLLLVCGSGTTLCHGWIGRHPEMARLRGFTVSTNSKNDPAEMKVEHAIHGWVYLTNDGGWRPA